MTKGMTALVLALAALAVAAGCSSARTAGRQWGQQDMLQIAEVTATAEQPEMAVAEVAVTAEGPMLVVDEVEVRAERVPVELSDYRPERSFVN
jgi:hypothetical protein